MKIKEALTIELPAIFLLFSFRREASLGVQLNCEPPSQHFTVIIDLVTNSSGSTEAALIVDSSFTRTK